MPTEASEGLIQEHMMELIKQVDFLRKSKAFEKAYHTQEVLHTLREFKMYLEFAVCEPSDSGNFALFKRDKRRREQAALLTFFLQDCFTRAAFKEAYPYWLSLWSGHGFSLLDIQEPDYHDPDDDHSYELLQDVNAIWKTWKGVSGQFVGW